MENKSSTQLKQMKSLKEQSLLKLIKGKRLSEALTFCESNQAYSDVCFNSVDMIKAIITECIGARAPSLFQDREDLETTEQWLAFADGISKGFSFKYGIVYDEDVELATDKPQPFYDIDLKDGQHAQEFYIEGLLPEQGSNLMLVQLSGIVRSQGAFISAVDERDRVFIYGNEHPNPKAILEWLAFQALREFMKLGRGEVEIRSLGNDDEDGEVSIRLNLDNYKWGDLISQVVNLFEVTGAIEAISEKRNVVDLQMDALTGKVMEFYTRIDYLQF